MLLAIGGAAQAADYIQIAESDSGCTLYIDGTELVAEGALAIELGATASDIAQTIHAHPTLPESIMEASEAVHEMAVHIFQKPKP